MYCIGPHVCVNNSKIKNSQERKAHVNFGTAAATKVVFGLFLIIALATNIKIPKYRTNPNATYTKQVMNRFHEVNELYDGILNEVHHFLYSTEISSKKCFTFQNAMKQEDKL